MGLKEEEEAKAAAEAAAAAAKAAEKVAAEAAASGDEDIEVIGSVEAESAKGAEGVKNILGVKDSSPELDSDRPEREDYRTTTGHPRVQQNFNIACILNLCFITLPVEKIHTVSTVIQCRPFCLRNCMILLQFGIDCINKIFFINKYKY